MVTMTRAEIKQRVIQILAESLVCEESELADDAALGEDLAAQDPYFLEITFLLDHEFGIDISCEELFPRANRQQITVGQVVQHICDMLSVR